MARSGKSPKPVALAAPPSALIEYFAAQLAASRTSAAVDKAQCIIFDALECEEPRRRVAMARRALKVSPDCADAYVLLAQEAAPGRDEEIALYEQGVAAGARALGPAAFEEDVGMFWGLLETRPYMRARAGLALALWEAGRVDEALSHAQDMLRLNPNDNQGVRYVVLNWLQRLGRNSEADQLFRRYKDDASAEFLWPAALAAFRRHGDKAASRRALSKAVESNPYVPVYLLGRQRPPRGQADFVAMGGKDEAAEYAREGRDVWRGTPGALEWLASAQRR